MPPTAILSIFLHKLMAGSHCRTGFPRGVVPRRFLGFSLYWSTGKFKKKRSSLLELRTLFRFRLYKRKIGLLIQNDPRRKSKSDQKTLCTCHRISGYVAFSSKPSRIPLLQSLRPQYAMKPGYCLCCFLQSDGQKSSNWLIMNYKKHHTDTQGFFLLLPKSQAKERFSDRSPVRRSLFCLTLLFQSKLREKKHLCASVGLLESSVNLFPSSTLFGKVDTHLYSIDTIDYELHVSDTDSFFLSPFSLSLSLSLSFSLFLSNTWSIEFDR